MEYRVFHCEQMVKIIIEPLPANFVQTHHVRFVAAHSNRECNVDRTVSRASGHPGITSTWTETGPSGVDRLPSRSEIIPLGFLISRSGS